MAINEDDDLLDIQDISLDEDSAENSNEVLDVLEDETQEESVDVWDDDDLSEDGDPSEEPSKPKKKKEKRKPTKGDIIRRCIMFIALGVFIYCGVKLFFIMGEYNEGENIYNSVTNSVFSPNGDKIPSSADITSGGEFKYNHAALVAINPDAIGYMLIPAIGAQYPLVQGTDNDYYLNHTITGEELKAGTLFVDYRITGGFSANQLIIYGHNLAAGGMFTGLLRYQNGGFFYEGNNRTLYIYSGNQRYTYEIFSCYVTDPVSDTYSFNFSSVEDMRKYAKVMQERSLYSTDINLDNATQILTLSTCTNDLEARVIVHAVLTGVNGLN